MTYRDIISFSVCFLVLSLGHAHAQDQEQVARPAKVWTVEASETEFKRSYPAIIEPSQEAVLSFRVSGRVVELPVLASTRVEEGDLIAQVDPRDFERQVTQLESQRDQAEAQLRALKAGARTEEVAAIEAGIDAIQAQVDQAKEQLERTQELADRGVVAEAQLEADQANLRVAEAQLRAEQEQLIIAQTGGREEDIDAAEASLRGLEAQLSAARDNLDDTSLRAPFDGIISRRNIDNFTNIQAGQDIVLLQKLSTVHVVFDVPGPDVIIFSGADEVDTQVIFDAEPETEYPAELVEFTTQADSATQTYRGRVAVELPEQSRILPGMVGRIVAATEVDAVETLLVPLTSVGANTDGSAFVWLVDPGSNTVSKKNVTLGDVSGADIAVTDGIAAGDTVVSAGITQLQDGMTIRPVTQIGG